MGAVGATISCVSPATVTASLLVGSHPWRTFRAHRGQHHYSGFYWSATMGDHVVYESRLTRPTAHRRAQQERLGVDRHDRLVMIREQQSRKVVRSREAATAPDRRLPK